MGHGWDSECDSSGTEGDDLDDEWSDEDETHLVKLNDWMFYEARGCGAGQCLGSRGVFVVFCAPPDECHDTSDLVIADTTHSLCTGHKSAQEAETLAREIRAARCRGLAVVVLGNEAPRVAMHQTQLAPF